MNFMCEKRYPLLFWGTPRRKGDREVILELKFVKDPRNLAGGSIPASFFPFSSSILLSFWTSRFWSSRRWVWPKQRGGSLKNGFFKNRRQFLDKPERNFWKTEENLKITENNLKNEIFSIFFWPWKFFSELYFLEVSLYITDIWNLWKSIW